MHDINGNTNRDPNSSSSSSSLKKRRASASVHQQQQPPQRQHPSQTPTRQGGYPSSSTKDDDGSPRSLSPPSSRILATPSTAGTGPTASVEILDRHPNHHHPYSSFRGGSDDGIDDRDDRISDSRESLRDRDGRDLEMDLKRPLPLEPLDRDVEMRSPHDDIDMRAVKKMRMEEGRTAPIGGIP